MEYRYKLSKTSKERLYTCSVKLQELMIEAIKTSPVDFSIICGHRNKEDQDKAYEEGFSKVRYPKGKHNKYPSHAVDIAPYPNLFEASTDEWLQLSKHIQDTAKRLNIDIRWGGDWNNNGDYTDESFLDLPHWELKDGL